MNKILKILYLLLITFSIGCSSDDSTGSANDPILGTWGNYKDTFIDDDGVEMIEEEYNPYYEIAIFNPDGTASTEIYLSGGQIEGTWENIGNNNYHISILGITETFSIEFICDGNVMKWDDDGYGYFYYEKIGFDNDTCDED